MSKITEKKIKRTMTEELKDILCNKCGKSLKGADGNYNGLIETEIYGAYDSIALEDCYKYTFSLCEECLEELFEEFEIPVKEEPVGV